MLLLSTANGKIFVIIIASLSSSGTPNFVFKFGDEDGLELFPS